MAAPVKAVFGVRPTFEAGAPEALFEIRVPSFLLAWPFSLYDVTADGKRFLFTTSGGDTAEAPLTVVLNWQAGVKK